MSRAYSLAGLLLVASVAGALVAPILNPALGQIFPADQARALLKQCSRPVPQGVQGTWTPRARDIARLERGFPAAVARAMERDRLGSAREQVMSRMNYYARQYGGVVIADRKYIYVNAFPTHLIDFDHSDATERMYPQWRKQPAIVCDGGPGLFGTLFDPSTDQFSHFAFNGVA